MEETKQQAICNREESDRNDETDRKRAKLLQEPEMKASTEPEKMGSSCVSFPEETKQQAICSRKESNRNAILDRNEAALYKDTIFVGAKFGLNKPAYVAPKVPQPEDYEIWRNSLPGFAKHVMATPEEVSMKVPNDPWADKNAPFLCGGATRLTQTGRNDRVSKMFAEEAIKVYNNTQKEEKLEFVKVTEAFMRVVNGMLYELTFEAKVIVDGSEGRTKTCYAEVWLKCDGNIEVSGFKFIDDGQGNEIWFWKRR